MTGRATPTSASGIAFGLGAFFLWGLFPAFFEHLDFAGAAEVLAHRVVWTLLVMLGVLAALRRLGELRRISSRTWLLVAAASAAIAINWGVYIYGVTSEQVVQCALGYFVNPLVSVLLGVVFFRERIVGAQWVALGFAVVAVAVLTGDYGRPPWIALILACSFASYGLIKKVVPLDPLRSLTAEGLVAAPLAVGYLTVLAVTGAGAFVADGTPHSLLMLACGPVTTLPLLLFGAAAQRLPLVTMGIIQYLTPALQMAWGVTIMHEAMPPSRWIGFALIWCALIIFTVTLARSASSARSAR